MLGTLACTLGDAGFAWFLADQDEVTNPRLVTFYMLAALASLYAMLTQLNLYRCVRLQRGRRRGKDRSPLMAGVRGQSVKPGALTNVASSTSLLSDTTLTHRSLEGFTDDDEEDEDAPLPAAAAGPAPAQLTDADRAAAAKAAAAAAAAEEVRARARREALNARIAAYSADVAGKDVFSMVARGVLGSGGSAATPAAAAAGGDTVTPAPAAAAAGADGGRSTAVAAGAGAGGAKKRR